MLIPARFTSLGHAYEVCLQLLTTSLAESPAGQGSAPGDDLVALQRQLARLCAALLAKDWRKVPVVPEALIAWRREERELQLARQVREEAAVPAASGPTADELIEQVSATTIPQRFRKAKALRAPKLGAQRTLLSLLQAMPVGTIQRTCEALLGGQARDKATAVEALQGAFERRSALRSAVAFLGEVERVILAALLKVGGELPLADLPAGMGPPLQQVEGPELPSLALLEALGLVHLGTDSASEAVLVVLPMELRDWLLESAAPVVTPDHLQLHIQLVDIEPPIWRRVQLRGDATLRDLHDAIQDAFRWRRSHLHEFRNAVHGPEVLGGMAHRNNGSGPPTPDERTVPIAQVLPSEGDTLAYWYDFGDDWWHLVRREAPTAPSLKGSRRLLGGERAGPLEDCGGPAGYALCVAVAKGREEDEDLLEWLGAWRPEAFNFKYAQRRFGR